MRHFTARQGLGTLVTHAHEGDNPDHAHVTPIYQTSTFGFPDVKTGMEIFSGECEGYIYSRIDNPNAHQLAQKYSVLEGLDLLRANPDIPPEEIVGGRVFSSGMAAISTAILARVRAGETIVAQKALYGNTFSFMHDLAPRIGIDVVMVETEDLAEWERVLNHTENVSLIYLETPANPTMQIFELEALTQMAHAKGAWVMVDNTFATPYCQRPLTYGIDVVVHSTTKYLTGHGLVVGGAVVTRHPDFLSAESEQLFLMSKILGGVPSPTDAWLSNIGLKTFELRMQRHCENAMTIARWLEDHQKIETVYFPGLESHPGHDVAKKQMPGGFGGMLSFEVQGGFEAGAKLMDELNMITLAVSLGNVDSLIQHPASMTHACIPKEEREAAGITDGLVRFSVGIENVEDVIEDLAQALSKV